MKLKLVLFACTAALAVCLTIVFADSSLSAAPAKVRTVNVHDRYSINLPTYFTKGYDLNSEASLEYQNIEKEVSLSLTSRPQNLRMSLRRLMNTIPPGRYWTITCIHKWNRCAPT
jgi:hypothetical protein